MKTIVRNENNISIYVFDDSETVVLKNDCVEVGNPVDNTILDCNKNNVTLHENVTPPSDWDGHKYFYDGSWSLNPNYNNKDIKE